MGKLSLNQKNHNFDQTATVNTSRKIN